MNGRPSCWKISSWPNWKGSIVGYSPCPLPAQVPSSHASGAQLGWMFSGISKGMGLTLLGVGRGHVASHPAQRDQGDRSDAEHGRGQHHDEEGFHVRESMVEPCAP